MFEHLGLATSLPEVRATFVRQTLRQQFDILAALTRHYSLTDVGEAFPSAYRIIFGELLLEHLGHRPARFIDAMVDALHTARQRTGSGPAGFAGHPQSLRR